MQILLLFGAILIGPGLVSFFYARLRPRRQRLEAVVVAFLIALVPAAWMITASQQADGITRAAAVVVVPMFALLMWASAGVGFFLARKQ